MSIQMQFLQTTLNTQQSFSISGGRGIVINILTIKFILLTNILIIFVLKSEYCVQVLSVFLRCFLAETLHVFNVFFVRNTCKVCKCPRERHDIYNENFVNIRDRLGWKRNDDPSAQVSKDRTLREGYTWIPPGLSSEQVN